MEVRNSLIESLSRRHLTLVICVASASWGLYWACKYAWVCDDAFISFRYARNLVEGHGLVFNAGEQVEGYTNFLWTLMLAAGMGLNLDPVWLSIVLSITCYAGLVAVLLWASRQAPSGLPCLPFAAIGVLLHHDLQVYATSGLETALFTFLVTAGVLVLTIPRQPFTRSAGILLTLAALTRPEGLLVAGLAGLWLLAVAKPGWKTVLRYALPLLFVYLPYWIWRFDYYGWPFPNTYYAKSGDLTYYGQGIRYLWLYLSTYYVLWAVPFALAALLWRVVYRRQWADQEGRVLLLAGSLVLLYTFYVVRVGGDFMFARFLLPITPLAFVLVEHALGILLTSPCWRWAVAALLVLAVGLRTQPYEQPRQQHYGITDEWHHYPPDAVKRAQRDGTTLATYVREPDMVAGFGGSRAMLVYYANIPTAIEISTGLTDEFVAHQSIPQRQRPGHEKPAPMDYLIKRGACLSFTDSPPRAPLKRIQFSGPDGTEVRATINYYDGEYLESLQDREGVEFLHLPTWLDDYIKVTLPGVEQQEVRQLLHFLDDFYFQHNEDPLRRAALLQRIGEVSLPSQKIPGNS